MSIEKIVLSGRRKRKISGLVPLFSDLGFNRVTLNKGKLTVEKSLGKTLEGKKELDYMILFEEKQIVFTYSVFSESHKRVRRIESFSTLLEILLLISDFYTLDMEPVINSIMVLSKDLKKIMEKEGINLTQKIDEVENKNEQLMRKYQDLVLSSEENARLLLEVERRNNELMSRLKKVEGVSSESLKEELFKWIKLHEGYLDVAEFARTYKIPHKRVEEGVNLLIKEGYIRKKG